MAAACGPSAGTAFVSAGIAGRVVEAWLDVVNLNAVVAGQDGLACLQVVFRLYMCRFLEKESKLSYRGTELAARAQCIVCG